jgi:hypothetical protein
LSNSQAWWCTPVVSGTWEPEARGTLYTQEFGASQGNTVKPVSKRKKKKLDLKLVQCRALARHIQDPGF